jgi:flagellin-like hook-associated protein FlgL
VSEMTKNQILTQSGIAVLGQANTTTKMALNLLQGGA